MILTTCFWTHVTIYLQGHFLLKKSAKKHDPISPLQPEPQDTSDIKHIFLTKLRMNQEAKLSVSIKPLTTKNHETKFFYLIHNLFCVTPFDWKRHVGSKILDDHSKQNKICLLCVQPTRGGKKLLYQTVDAQLKCVCIYISPLISLGSDQVNKFIPNNHSDDTLSLSL